MRIAFYGAAGKVGGVLEPALVQAGHAGERAGGV
jgi:hypothetical protein